MLSTELMMVVPAGTLRSPIMTSWVGTRPVMQPAGQGKEQAGVSERGRGSSCSCRPGDRRLKQWPEGERLTSMGHYNLLPDWLLLLLQ
jgi:hypothetical protein